jgi:tripartite-type tricarboxylate transporter receptor subunit TctC
MAQRSKAVVFVAIVLSVSLAAAQQAGSGTPSNNSASKQQTEARELFRLGFEAKQKNQNADAEVLFTKGLKLLPNDSLAHFYLGETQLALGKKKEAQVAFEAALRYGLDSERGKRAEEAIKLSISAAQWPTKPINLVVPTVPGSMTDRIARAVAEPLTQGLAVQVNVENKAGPGGRLASEYVAAATPDGYTLQAGTTNSHSIAKAMGSTYDPISSFTPIGMIDARPLVLFVNASSPLKSLPAIIASAKSRPGTISYASPGPGTLEHLAFEVFKLRAGIDVAHVPYQGMGPALLDVAAGHSTLVIADPHVVKLLMSGARSGSLQPLAITSVSRSATMPDLPTVSESVPSFEGVLQWTALFAPAATPAIAVERLRTELSKALDTPAVRAKLAGEGGVQPQFKPEELKNFIRLDADRWSEVVLRQKLTLR